MLPSIVGPPLKGVADLGAADKPKAESLKESKKAGSDSFGQMLGAKEKSEMKPTRADSPPRVTNERREAPQGESGRKAEKLKATNDDGTKKKEASGSQREEAILKFMDSFESEFGVPPTRIVEAIANLDATQQADSPEETADQVIGQLGLDDQDEDQAKNMYMGLLTQLAQIEKQPVLPAKPEMLSNAANGAAMGGGAMALERFSTDQQKRQALNSSLDNMNEKFWMKGAQAGQGAGGALPQGDLADKIAQMSMQDKLGQNQGLSSLNIDESSFARNLGPQLPPQAAPMAQMQSEEGEATQSPEAALAALVAAARAAKSRADVSGMAEEDSQTSFEVGDESALAIQDKPAQIPGAAPKSVDALAQQNPRQGFESFQQQHQQQSQQGLNGQGNAQTAKGEMLEKTKLGEKANFKSILGTEGAVQASNAPGLKPDLIANVAPMAAPANTATTPGENEANVRQLMNQAQYLIKKGGGEMKVQMSPEGMGQIHMKVLVENGKVNVQMAAETSEAKKTLESGLSDLKNSLAAHKLSMDHVKIDVVNSANADNNLQNQMNQDQGGRDQTRQFWNKFSENFGSSSQQRENFTDIPNLRGYPRKRTDEALEPVRSAGVNKYAAAGKGKGLNLVA